MANKPRAKQIKLSTLDSKNKQNNKMSAYMYDTETGHTIKYYEVFPEKKIDALIEDLYKTMTYVEENKIPFPANDTELMNYVLYLTVKHFTHLKDDIGDKFEDNLKAMEILYDTRLYQLCHEALFNPEQVNLVLDKVTKAALLSDKIKDTEKQARNEIEEKVVNTEILGK